MKIIVCINHVPDTATKINICESNKSIDPTGVTYIINPFDEFALEEALKTKENTDAKVLVLSIGADSNKESIKKALAMGADAGILLKSSTELDSIGIAKVLANEIKSQDAQLIFMGKQSVDFDNGIVGQLTAELLDFNCISTVTEFSLSDSVITASREIEGGYEIVETSLPCIITAQKGLNDPRYPNLKGIMAAKKKIIEEKDVSTELVSYTEIIEITKPAEKSTCKIVGEDSSAVPELVRLLREEAKVI